MNNTIKSDDADLRSPSPDSTKSQKAVYEEGVKLRAVWRELRKRRTEAICSSSFMIVTLALSVMAHLSLRLLKAESVTYIQIGLIVVVSFISIANRSWKLPAVMISPFLFMFLTRGIGSYWILRITLALLIPTLLVYILSVRSKHKSGGNMSFGFSIWSIGILTCIAAITAAIARMELRSALPIVVFALLINCAIIIDTLYHLARSGNYGGYGPTSSCEVDHPLDREEK